MNPMTSLFCSATLLLTGCVAPKQTEQKEQTEIVSQEISAILQTYVIKKSSMIPYSSDQRVISIDDAGDPLADSVRVEFKGRSYLLVKPQDNE